MKTFYSILLFMGIVIFTSAQQFIPLAQTYFGHFGKAGKGEMVIYCSGYSDYGKGSQPNFQGKATIENNAYSVFGTQRDDGEIQLDLHDEASNTAFILEVNSQQMYLGSLKGTIYNKTVDGKKLGKLDVVADIARDDLYDSQFTGTSSTGVNLNVGFTYFEGHTYLSLVPATTNDGIIGVFGKPTLETETTKEYKELFCTYTFLWKDGQLYLLIDNLAGSESCNPTFAVSEKIALKKQ